MIPCRLLFHTELRNTKIVLWSFLLWGAGCFSLGAALLYSLIWGHSVFRVGSEVGGLCFVLFFFLCSWLFFLGALRKYRIEFREYEASLEGLQVRYPHSPVATKIPWSAIVEVHIIAYDAAWGASVGGTKGRFYDRAICCTLVQMPEKLKHGQCGWFYAGRAHKWCIILDYTDERLEEFRCNSNREIHDYTQDYEREYRYSYVQRRK